MGKYEYEKIIQFMKSWASKYNIRYFRISKRKQQVKKDEPKEIEKKEMKLKTSDVVPNSIFFSIVFSSWNDEPHSSIKF